MYSTLRQLFSAFSVRKFAEMMGPGGLAFMILRIRPTLFVSLLVAVMTSSCAKSVSFNRRPIAVSLPVLETTLDAKVRIKVFLQGAYDSTQHRMKGVLQTRGFIPTLDPYGSGEQVDPVVLNNPHADGVEDWVVVELRSATQPALVLFSRSALLLKNGEIVDLDGSSDVLFTAVTVGSYYVAIQHRNHLGVMTAAPVLMRENPDLIDFTDPSVATYGGADARRVVGSDAMLFAGDINQDGKIMYTGAGNDRDLILAAIGGSVPTNVIAGYHVEDINLDGNVVYTGEGNDRDIILQNIGGAVPTDVRLGTVPR